MDVRALEDDLGGSVRHIGMGKGDALIWTEALAHGTLPWRCAKTSAWLEFSSEELIDRSRDGLTAWLLCWVVGCGQVGAAAARAGRAV